MLTLTEETCLRVHLRQASRQLQDQLSHHQAPRQLQEQLSHHCATQQRQHQIQLPEENLNPATQRSNHYWLSPQCQPSEKKCQINHAFEANVDFPSDTDNNKHQWSPQQILRIFEFTTQFVVWFFLEIEEWSLSLPKPI